MGGLEDTFEAQIGKSVFRMMLKRQSTKQSLDITVWDPSVFQLYDASFSEDYLEELNYLPFFENCKGLFKYLKSQHQTVCFDFDKHQMSFDIIINAVLKNSKTLLFPIKPRCKNLSSIVNEQTSVIQHKLILSKPASVSREISFNTVVNKWGKVKILLELRDNKEVKNYYRYITKIDQACFRRYCVSAKKSMQNIGISVGTKELLTVGKIIDASRPESFTFLVDFCQMNDFGSIKKVSPVCQNHSIIYVDVDTLNFKINLWVDKQLLITSKVPQRIRDQQLYLKVLLYGDGTQAELFLEKQ